MSSNDANTNETNKTTGVKLPLGLAIDIQYVLSPQAFLKIGLAVLSIIGTICVASERAKDLYAYCDKINKATYSFYEFVTVSAFLCAIGIYAVCLLAVHKKLPAVIPWTLIHMVWTGIYILFFFCGSVALAAACKLPCCLGAFKAGTVLGFFCLAILCGSMVLLFFEFRSERASAASTRTQDPPAEQTMDQY